MQRPARGRRAGGDAAGHRKARRGDTRLAGEGGFDPLPVGCRHELGEAGGQRGERLRRAGLADFAWRARQQGIEAGRHVRTGDARRVVGRPGIHALQRVAVGQVGVADGQPAGPAPAGLGHPGLAAGQRMAQGGGEQAGAAAAGGQVVGAAAFAPQALGECEAVGALAGVVDGVGDVDAAFGRDAVEIVATGGEQGGGLRVGVGFVPQGAREDRRAVLVAGEAQRAVGVDDLRPAAGAVVLDQLELEAAGRLVVADDLEHRRFFLVADVQAVLEVGRGIGARLGVDRDHHAREGEIVRGRGGALQRAPEWDQDALRRRQRTSVVACQLGVEAGEQGGEGEGQLDACPAVAVDGEQLVEQGTAGGREVVPGSGRVDDPGRRRAGAFSRCPHDCSRPAGEGQQPGQEGVAQVHGGFPSSAFSTLPWRPRRRRCGAACRASILPGPCRS